MATVLITGANRGLGLEFCRQYAEQDWHVIACSRNPDDAFDLNNLATHHNVQIEALDVAEFEQIDALSKKLADLPIDVLINNAGIYTDNSTNGFGHLDYQAWTKSLVVNTEAPLKMAEAFLPQIKRGNKKLIVNISSLMGSIADNDSGGSIFYRSSKAALNAAMKSLAIALKDQSVGVLIFHPGWVKTDMGGPNGLINADQSITGMRALIENFSLDQSGSFVKYDGTPMPW
ncbi:SDR family oxidoreductase [Methylobacter tundripaludum]|uniref:SDR family oxidoreductase n=1 Tax=Methylobacter tundripaludum TaxID=173365 RepID=UPI0004826C37|nr:SDR family oxidoreductase [Methylobacter tundripaludum]